MLPYWRYVRRYNKLNKYVNGMRMFILSEYVCIIKPHIFNILNN